MAPDLWDILYSLYHGTRWRWVISFMLRPPYAQGRTLDIHFICGWVDASGSLYTMWRRQFFPRRESYILQYVSVYIFHIQRNVMFLKYFCFRVTKTSTPVMADVGSTYFEHVFLSSLSWNPNKEIELKMGITDPCAHHCQLRKFVDISWLWNILCYWQ
jgi:hypothetical protein